MREGNVTLAAMMLARLVKLRAAGHTNGDAEQTTAVHVASED